MPDRVLRVYLTGDSAGLEASMAKSAAATDAASDAMSDSLGGVSKDAEKAGKDSEGFFSKMAGGMSNLGLPFSSSMEKIGAKLDATTTKGQKFAQSMRTIGAATLAIGAAAAVGIGAESIKMANEFDDAQVLLKTAVIDSGSSWSKLKGSIDAVEKSAANMGFNMTEAAGALQILTTATNDPKKAMADLGLAEDLARMKGISLAAASQTLAKVYAGSTRALTQLGINIDIGTGKLTAIHNATVSVATAQLHLKQTEEEVAAGSLKGLKASIALENAHRSLSNAEQKLALDQGTIAKILATVTDRTKGAAKAYGSTLTGQMDIAKAHIHDLGITFGEFLIPKLNSVIKIVTSVVTWFTKNTLAAKILGGMITGVLGLAVTMFVATKVRAFVSGLSNMMTSFSQFVTRFVSGSEVMAETSETEGEAAAAGFGPIGIAIGGAMLAMTLLLTHWKQVMSGIKSIGAGISVVIHNPAQAAKDVGKKIQSWIFGSTTTTYKVTREGGGFLIGPIPIGMKVKITTTTTKSEGLSGWFKSQYEGLLAQFKGLPAELASLGVDLWHGILGVPAFFKSFAKTFDLGGLVNIFKSGGTAIWDYLVSSFKAAPGFFKNLGRGIYRDLDLAGLGHIFKNFGTTAWSGILIGVHTLENAWGNVWGNIKAVGVNAWHALYNNALHPIWHFFSVAFYTVIHGAETAWNHVWGGILSAVQHVWSVLKPIFHAISVGVGGITGAVSTVAGAVGGAAGWVGKHLGTGGLVTSPTVAMIGEGGPELVLNQKMTHFVMSGGSVNANPMRFTGGGAAGTSGMLGPITINVKVNERTIATAIAPAMRAALLRGGRGQINIGLA